MVTMSSPLHSQERIRSSDHDDDNIHEPEDVSQGFFTQLSQLPTPRHQRRPLASKQPRVAQDREPHQLVSRHDHPSLLIAAQKTKLPPHLEKDLTDSVGRTSAGVVATLQSPHTIQQPADDHALPEKPVPTSSHLQVPKAVEDDQWPGGKTALSNGGYLPRSLAKISKYQQEILQAVHAWQPSKVDRKIRGSVPNDILKHFTELADKAAEIASSEERVEPQPSPGTDKATEDAQPQHQRETTPPDAASESSDSEIRPPWSPSPPNSAAPKPALPDNSSPLRGPQRRSGPLPPRFEPPTKDAMGDRTQDALKEPRLGTNSPARLPLSEIEHTLQRAEVSPCAGTIPGSVKRVRDNETADKQGSSMSHTASLEDSCSPAQEERETAKPSKSCSSGSDCDKAPQDTGSLVVVLQGQGDSSQQKGDGKDIIQVQRTPFVHQPSKNIKRPDLGSRTALRYSTPGEAGPPHESEPKSSTSVVPGTFMGMQADQSKRFRPPSPGPLHHDSETLRNEPTMGKGKVTEASRPTATVHGASETHPPSSSEDLSEPEERASRHRAGKRKYSSDEHASFRTTENQRSGSELTTSKRPRADPTFASLEALRDISIPKAPSDIARESRRAFFQDQQRVRRRKSPVSIPAFPVDEPRREDHAASPLPTQRKASDIAERSTTQRASQLSRLGAKPGSGLSLTRPNIYDAYTAAYPEYAGDVVQFRKACKQIKMLCTKGKAPHPSLWDDFIFRRHHDYRGYLLKVSEGCEDALPYLEYYTQHVEKPSRMELVVKPSHILSLEPDSAIGSSVTSPPSAAPIQMEAAMDLERSVAVSSSASNILPKQNTMSPAPPRSRHRTSRHEETVPASQPAEELELTQESSVKKWVELQSIEKPLGAESPELGSPVIPAANEVVPEVELEHVTERVASLPPRHQPAEAREKAWYHDPNTPFKNFARSFAALPSEKRLLQQAGTVDAKGSTEPDFPSVLDIFTLYRR